MDRKIEEVIEADEKFNNKDEIKLRSLKICSDFEPIEELIKEQIMEQTANRYVTIRNLYDLFLERPTFKDINKNDISLNNELLVYAISRYFRDIIEFKLFSQSEFAENIKACAYSIKWITKLKPISVINNSDLSEKINMINSYFAYFVGFAFLKLTDKEIDKMNNEIMSNGFLYREFIFGTFIKDVCPKQLTALINVIYKSVKNR